MAQTTFGEGLPITHPFHSNHSANRPRRWALSHPWHPQSELGVPISHKQNQAQLLQEWLKERCFQAPFYMLVKTEHLLPTDTSTQQERCTAMVACHFQVHKDFCMQFSTIPSLQPPLLRSTQLSSSCTPIFICTFPCKMR